MQRIQIGKRQTVPEPARGTRLKEDENLPLLDHRVADASQKVRLADSRPPPDGAHSRFPGHALTPTGVMAIRCKQFHLPDL